MRQTPIVRFLLHLLLLSPPLLVAAAVYVVLDPFKVVWHYDNYYERQAPHPSLDMDYVSCENYLARRDTCHYNAYLMGNSRSQFWQVADWLRHLPEGAVGYHYYGNGETLYRLNCHIRFLHEQQATIDHKVLHDAFMATSMKRNTTDILPRFDSILEEVKTDPAMQDMWNKYCRDNFFVGELTWDEVYESFRKLKTVASSLGESSTCSPSTLRFTFDSAKLVSASDSTEV